MIKIDLELLKWAVEELRDLDEAARWGIVGFDSWNSGEMDKVHLLERLVKEGTSKKKAN